jgi:hypothetical protein
MSRDVGVRVLCGALLLVDLLPYPAATEGVSCTFVVGARYVEWVTMSARLDHEVVR